jgi:hypothetical protein
MRRVWERGRHLSPRPQQTVRNPFLVLFVHKNLDSLRLDFRPDIRLALESFGPQGYSPFLQPLSGISTDSAFFVQLDYFRVRP